MGCNSTAMSIKLMKNLVKSFMTNKTSVHMTEALHSVSSERLENS